MFINRRHNTAKTAILSKLNYIFGIIPIKSPSGFYAEVDKLILKWKQKCKRLKIAKGIFKWNKVGELPSYKMYYKVIKISYS